MWKCNALLIEKSDLDLWLSTRPCTCPLTFTLTAVADYPTISMCVTPPDIQCEYHTVLFAVKDFTVWSVTTKHLQWTFLANNCIWHLISKLIKYTWAHSYRPPYFMLFVSIPFALFISIEQGKVCDHYCSFVSIPFALFISIEQGKVCDYYCSW